MHWVRHIRACIITPFTSLNDFVVEERDLKLFEKAMEVERRGGVMDIFEISLEDELKLILGEILRPLQTEFTLT
jgi:hypothetical protein